jgi:hypothetical protein
MKDIKERVWGQVIVIKYLFDLWFFQKNHSARFVALLTPAAPKLSSRSD